MLGFYLLPKGFRTRPVVYKFESINSIDDSYVEFTYKRLFGRLYYLVRVIHHNDTNSPGFGLDNGMLG